MGGNVRGAVALAPWAAQGQYVRCTGARSNPLCGHIDTVRGVIMVAEEWPRTNGP
jgi:hypothetical protein